MSDVVERAEAAAYLWEKTKSGCSAALMRELVAELKAARAEADGERQTCDLIEIANRQTNEAFTRVALERNRLRAELEAARAENDGLRNELNQRLIEAHLAGFTEGQRRIT